MTPQEMVEFKNSKLDAWRKRWPKGVPKTKKHDTDAHSKANGTNRRKTVKFLEEDAASDRGKEDIVGLTMIDVKFVSPRGYLEAWED